MIPAALNRASAAPRFENAIIDSIFWDDRPIVGNVGKTIEILVPIVNPKNAVNIGSGSLVPNVANHNNVALTITQKISNTYPLPINISALTEVDLAKFYFEPWLEETVRACGLDMMNVLVNGDVPTPVGSFVTQSTKSPTTNFGYTDVNGVAQNNEFTGTGVGHPNRADLATANAILFQSGVPTRDTANMIAMTSGKPYFGMTADPAYSQNYFVGQDAAVDAQQYAQLKTISGATVVGDQYFPTGANNAFYTMFFHRYAHAGRFITEETPWNQVSRETIVYPKPNMPVRVSYFYSPKDEASYISFNCLYGVTTVRPDWRVLIQN